MNRIVLLIVVAALLSGAAANADPIEDNVTARRQPPNVTSGTILLWGGTLKGAEGYGGIDLLAVSSSPPPGGEGASLMREPDTGYLCSFCIELSQSPPNSWVTYDVVMPQDAPDPGTYVPGAMGFQKQEYLCELWGRFHDMARASGDNAEVFSACVWEIVYEDNASVWDVTTMGSAGGRGFRCANADTALANAWLGMLNGEGPKASLRALTSPDYQDFLVEIPEPATMSLVMLGVAAAAFIRRRRPR